MKKLMTIALALCMVMSLPVYAEETEIESEVSDEPAKGSRLDPYNFDEDIPLGTIYAYEDEYADVTLNFTEIIDPDTLSVLAPDEDWGEEGRFAVRCKVSIGEGCTDDDYIYVEMYSHILTDDMNEQYSSWILYDSPNDSLNKVYTYMDYDAILLCQSKESYDLDQKYIKIGIDNSVEELDSEDFGRYVWIEIPEY